MKTKRMLVNLFASILSFILSLGVNFFLTPYITAELGDEAYGYIGLANNFVSYAAVLVTALNSMASRFVAMEYHRKNEEQAKIYFSSVFYANIIMSAILLIAGIITIINLNKILNISPDLYMDVIITFLVVFLTYIISIVTSIYSVSTFVKNRIDLASIRNIVSNIIKIIIILALFTFLVPKIYFVSLAYLAGAIYFAFANYILTQKLMPEMQVRLQLFDFTAIKKLLSSGVWNSLNSLSQMLLTGLDLLIANMFIDGTAMGVLSIAKIIPNAILSFLGTISAVFTPSFTEYYAKNDIKGLVSEAKFSIKVLSAIMTIPIAGFIVFGTDFFGLWLPHKSETEIMQLQILSVLSLGPTIFSSYIYSLYSINVTTNKLKVPVMLTVILSIFSTGLVFILLKTTNLGLYAVAGVSSCVLFFRVMIFVPVYAAYVLHIRWNTFYAPFLRAIGSCCIILGVFAIAKQFINIRSWVGFFCCVISVGVVGYIINFMIVMNRSEKKKFISLIVKKVTKKKAV